MQTLFPCVAGLDVHKNNVVVCVRITDSKGNCFQARWAFWRVAISYRIPEHYFIRFCFEIQDAK